MGEVELLDKYYQVEVAFIRELPQKYQTPCRLILTNEPFSKIYNSLSDMDVFQHYFKSALPQGDAVETVYSRLVLTKLTYLNPMFFEEDELKWMLNMARQMIGLIELSFTDLIEQTRETYPVFSQWLTRCIRVIQQKPAKMMTGVIQDSPDMDIAWCK